MAQGTHHQSCYSWIFLAFEWNQDEWTRMNRVSVMGIPYTLLVSAPGCGVMSLQWTTLWQAQLCQRAVPCTITFCNSVGSQWGIWETIPFMVSSIVLSLRPQHVYWPLRNWPRGQLVATDPLLRPPPKKTWLALQQPRLLSSNPSHT